MSRALLIASFVASTAATVSSSVERPRYAFPLRAAERVLVDAQGRVWPAFGRSQFALAWHGYHGRWDHVDMLLDRDAAEGFTYVRVFGMLSWLDPVWEPWSEPERYWRAWDELGRRAAERNIVVWFTVFADWNRLEGVSEERFVETAKSAAAYAKRHPNVILEVVNEWYVNGFSPERVRRAGRLMRGAGYDRLLIGSAPWQAAVSPEDFVPDDDARAFAGEPFDMVTLHTRRDQGHDGWEHVKEVRDSLASAETLERPLVLGEPMGYDVQVKPGIYDDSPTRALAAMLVAWVSGAAGYCYHADGGLWSRAERYPGEDRMHLFWTLKVPHDRRRWTFVNGHWPRAPITSATGFLGEPGFERGPYRLYGATSDRGEYFAVAFGGTLPWTLRVQRPLSLVRHDESGARIDPEPVSLAAGEALTERDRMLLILSGTLAKQH